MALIRIPYKDENREKLKELCWTAYKTSRIVFARVGECHPVIMCECNTSLDGKKKTAVIVSNVPMDEKRLIVHQITEKFQHLKPIRMAFVTEAYVSNKDRKEKQEVLMCHGSDKFGNMYIIKSEIVSSADEIKKLGKEEAEFVESGKHLWEGMFNGD